MSASQAVPSPFAVLLRRSKFASYDPAIGQVYTSPGGHAFRGDWGFKRPLANRRRSGFITVRCVDSPEQQTEWQSGESSARWMRRWEELGKKLEVDDMSPWRARIGPGTWRVDSEFDMTRKKIKYRLDPEGKTIPLDKEVSQEEEDDYFLESGGVPNPDAMTPRQFQKYLEHLRTLRPEFKQFLKLHSQELKEKREKSGQRPQLRSEETQLFFTGSGDIHMFHSAQNAPGRYVSKFLRRRTTAELKDPECTRIEQRPHPFGGLEYTWMSALQSKYLHKPAPGRNIGTNRSTRYRNSEIKLKYDLIAVGGVIGASESGTQVIPTDFGTRESPRIDRERGKGLFRMSKVLLDDAPRPVGRKPQQATDSTLRNIEFRVAHTSNLSNPYPLGSPEYIDQVNGIATGKGRHHPIPAEMHSMVRHVPAATTTQQSDLQSQQLIGKLSKMLKENEAQAGQK